MRKIIATFHPQAWINDQAVEVDQEDPCEFDVTDQVLAMDQASALLIEDDEYESDFLRHGDNVPAWIREWSGPFWVEVRTSIHQFFEE